MNEQNRLRLAGSRQGTRAATAHGAEARPTKRRRVPRRFRARRDEVLRPVMEEVGAQLRRQATASACAGGAEASPAVDFRVLIAGRGDSKDTIRFFAHKDTVRGWQVIAEIELKRSPVELTRFEVAEEITRDVAEQLLVDAVEQMFASTAGTPRKELPALVNHLPAENRGQRPDMCGVRSPRAV